LFTDVEGSTRLWEDHPDVMHDVLARHNEACAPRSSRIAVLWSRRRATGSWPRLPRTNSVAPAVRATNHGGSAHATPTSKTRIARLSPAEHQAALTAGRQHTLESAAHTALDALTTATFSSYRES
jgi:hypothetical protein